MSTLADRLSLDGEATQPSTGSQPIVLPPHAGRVLASPGVTHLLTGEETGGAYYLFEVLFAADSGTRLHVHRRETEVGYVLEGALEIRLAERTMIVEAGGVAHLPKHVPHALRNPLSTPSRCLFMAIPAGLEHWFDALAAASMAGGPDESLFRRLSQDFGLEWLE
jgi:quercetin dioxygenase-like cupin family protein